MKSLSEVKVRLPIAYLRFAKNAKFHFCPVFGIFYGFVNNFIVGFMYGDDVSRTYGNTDNLSFSNKKIQVPKILPTWVFVNLKCQQNFEILQLVWTLAPNTFWIMFQILDFCPNNSIAHIFYGNNHLFIFLQLSHNGCSNLPKTFIKLYFLVILSYH